MACGDLNIHYRGSEACPYGRLATQSREAFSSIVLHHNPPQRTLDWLIDYQLSGDPRRKGHFGYHFYVADNGDVIQGAPLSARTNHVKGLGYRARSEFGREARNENAIGITCVGAEKPEGFAPTAEQVRSVCQLVNSLSEQFDIPLERVFGHGELQTDRDPTEGASIAQYIRSWE